MSAPKSGSENSGNSGLQNSVHRTVGISQFGNDNKCIEFCWIVKGFSKISSPLIESPVFDGGELSKVKWLLKLYTKKRLDEKEYIGVYLYLAEGQKIEEIHVYFEITFHLNEIIKRVNSATNRKFSSKIYSFSDDNGWGFDKLMETPNSVKDDQIKIECKIVLNSTKLIHKIIGSSEYHNNDEENFKKLRFEYGEILQSKEHSDFEIKVQDENFKVHKAILSARSKVFSAMFSSQMQESINSSVKIEDFNETVVKNMLEFIYTGKTEILESNVQELLKIADKYDLPDLKFECEKYLIVYLLNKENCVLLLELADSFNASKLKAEAINFIINFKNQVSQTTLFQNLIKSNVSIGGEILMAEWKKNLPHNCSNELNENINERKRKREDEESEESEEEEDLSYLNLAENLEDLVEDLDLEE